MEYPYITSAQMREIDRLMVEECHIELIQMMENAGRNLARLARSRFLKGDPVGKIVLILAGSGGNGGGGLVCARFLHNWGAKVRVVVTKPFSKLKGVPKHQLDILMRMNISILVSDEKLTLQDSFDLIIDSLIGYSLRGAPRDEAARLIKWTNEQKVPVLSLDIPSGIDPTTGIIYDPTVKATATMTLALPKEGLNSEVAVLHVGELYLADISVPPELYSRNPINLKINFIFAKDEIIRL
ncbi:MAG: NAD(P)H-hydrate epimerase [Promethearchaeota archaeon]